MYRLGLIAIALLFSLPENRKQLKKMAKDLKKLFDEKNDEMKDMRRAENGRK